MENSSRSPPRTAPLTMKQRPRTDTPYARFDAPRRGVRTWPFLFHLPKRKARKRATPLRALSAGLPFSDECRPARPHGDSIRRRRGPAPSTGQVGAIRAADRGGTWMPKLIRIVILTAAMYLALC